MRNRRSNIICIVILLSFISTYTSAQSTAAKKPNIIFIMADDLGYGDLSCYNKASKIKTPNIDRIAAAGMKFTNAHSSSAVCTPSRYSVLTGRYAWRSRMKLGVLWTYDWPLIENGRLTVGQFLKNNGYNTGIIGKWHLGWNWPIKPGADIDTTRIGGRNLQQSIAREQQIDINKPLRGGPLACGFDYQFGIDIPSMPPFCFIENGRVVGPPLTDIKTDDLGRFPGYVQKGWQSDKILLTLMEKAGAFVAESAKSEKPFFLYLPLTVPHHPIAPSPQFAGKSDMGDYGDVVQEMDYYIGRLMQQLKQLGIDKNTLVIFTSDNGSIMDVGEYTKEPAWGIAGMGYKLYGHRSNKNFRGIKGDIYDGGHRVPFIAVWPGTIPAGSTSAGAVSLTDFFATCAGFIGKPIPAQYSEDSFDLSALLKGKKLNRPVRQSVIFHSSNGVFSLEKGPWKYIEANNSGGTIKFRVIPDTVTYDTPGQLYNIKTDPEEKENLYNKYPLVIKELSALLAEQKKTGTRFLLNP